MLFSNALEVKKARSLLKKHGKLEKKTAKGKLDLHNKKIQKKIGNFAERVQRRERFFEI